MRHHKGIENVCGTAEAYKQYEQSAIEEIYCSPNIRHTPELMRGLTDEY